MNIDISKVRTTKGRYVAQVKKSPAMSPLRILYIPELAREKSQIAQLLVIPPEETILKVGDYILFENWTGRAFPGIEDGIILEKENIAARIEL